MGCFRRFLVPVACASALFAAVAVPSPAAAGTTTPEARALRLVNAERIERDRGRVVRTAALDEIAERHARRMRAAGSIFHSDDLAAVIPGSWRAGGENVGYGPTVRSIHRAFMASPGHRRNILDPDWDEVGIGIVVSSSGRVYETQVFVDR